MSQSSGNLRIPGEIQQGINPFLPVKKELPGSPRNISVAPERGVNALALGGCEG